MPVRFNYVLNRGVFRPIIPVSFPTSSSGQFTADGLIDSGAPWSLFPGHVATILGHNTLKGREPRRMMIGGAKVSSYLHKTKVRIAERNFIWDIYFSHDIDDWEFGILGQEPFFLNFLITFNYIKKEISLEFS